MPLSRAAASTRANMAWGSAPYFARSSSRRLVPASGASGRSMNAWYRTRAVSRRPIESRTFASRSVPMRHHGQTTSEKMSIFTEFIRGLPGSTSGAHTDGLASPQHDKRRGWWCPSGPVHVVRIFVSLVGFELVHPRVRCAKSSRVTDRPFSLFGRQLTVSIGTDEARRDEHFCPLTPYSPPWYGLWYV